MLTMSSALNRCLRFHGRNQAIVDPSGTRTWTEHLGRVARAAALLQRLGVKRGERFGILSRNSFRHCELLHAGYWGGMVPVPVNVRLAPPEIAAILGDAQVKALAVDEPFVPLADSDHIKPFTRPAFVVAPGPVATRLPDYETLLADCAPSGLVESAEDDDAIVLYTGGTTGRSKGVLLTHRNVVSNGLQCAAEMGFRSDDIYLHVAPMFHSAHLLATGFTLLGGSHAFLAQFTPANLLKALQDLRVSFSMMAPTMIMTILGELRPADFDLRHLRTIVYGSAPMAPEWIRKAIDAFPGVAIAQGYGLTETSPILTYLDFAEHKKAIDSADQTPLTSAGRPIAGVELRVCGADGDEVPAGQPGEIVVRGPNVTKGYLNRPEETAAAIRAGWFHTGDIGRVDEDGLVYLMDRTKDMVVTGGENVYSTEVEQALYQHPDVSECAVIGVPHSRWGEALLAVIVPAPGRTLSAETLITHCRGRIGGFKIPREIVFVQELPKSAMGKILKTELRRRYADQALGS